MRTGILGPSSRGDLWMLKQQNPGFSLPNFKSIVLRAPKELESLVRAFLKALTSYVVYNGLSSIALLFMANGSRRKNWHPKTFTDPPPSLRMVSESPSSYESFSSNLLLHKIWGLTPHGYPGSTLRINPWSIDVYKPKKKKRSDLSIWTWFSSWPSWRCWENRATLAGDWTLRTRNSNGAVVQNPPNRVFDSSLFPATCSGFFSLSDRTISFVNGHIWNTFWRNLDD